MVSVPAPSDRAVNFHTPSLTNAKPVPGVRWSSKDMPRSISRQRCMLLEAAETANKKQNGYGSIPIHTIFRGMNIHLPAILMFTRGTRFWHTAKWLWPSLNSYEFWIKKKPLALVFTCVHYNWIRLGRLHHDEIWWMCFVGHIPWSACSITVHETLKELAFTSLQHWSQISTRTVGIHWELRLCNVPKSLHRKEMNKSHVLYGDHSLRPIHLNSSGDDPNLTQKKTAKLTRHDSTFFRDVGASQWVSLHFRTCKVIAFPFPNLPDSQNNQNAVPLSIENHWNSSQRYVMHISTIVMR